MSTEIDKTWTEEDEMNETEGLYNRQQNNFNIKKNRQQNKFYLGDRVRIKDCFFECDNIYSNKMKIENSGEYIVYNIFNDGKLILLDNGDIYSKDDLIFVSSKKYYPLFRYIKRKGKPIGYFVGVRCSNGKFYVAYSLCNKKDIFKKETARKIAHYRVNQYCMYDKNTIQIPFSIVNDYLDFVKKCERYFKCENAMKYTVKK